MLSRERAAPRARSGGAYASRDTVRTVRPHARLAGWTVPDSWRRLRSASGNEVARPRGAAKAVACDSIGALNRSSPQYREGRSRRPRRSGYTARRFPCRTCSAPLPQTLRAASQMLNGATSNAGRCYLKWFRVLPQMLPGASSNAPRRYLKCFPVLSQMLSAATSNAPRCLLKCSRGRFKCLRSICKCLPGICRYDTAAFRNGPRAFERAETVFTG